MLAVVVANFGVHVRIGGNVVRDVVEKQLFFEHVVYVGGLTG